MSDNIRLVEKVLKQKAVYWAHSGDDASGSPLYDGPVEIKCRWEEVSEVFLDADGSDQVSNAVVMVDRDLTIQGQLWLGKLEDLISQTIPSKNPGAYAIRKMEKIPDRKATKFARTAIL